MILSDVDITGYDTVFLDRDGVINKQIVGGYVLSWGEFEFIPGVLETLAKWNSRLKHILIVTNQRCVSKGLITEEGLKNIHANMIARIKESGGRIDKLYCCIALSESDPNRKPQTGMFVQACSDFPDICKETSLMVGDMDSDMAFAANCGIRGVQVEGIRK